MFNWILKEMVARSVEKPPVIDAQLNDRAWQSSDLAAEFYDLHNARPRNATVWVVCHDNQSLYVGILSQDGRIIATKNEKDARTEGDSIEVDLAPDGRLGWDYRFSVNAAGGRLDASPGDALREAHLNWRSATRSTATGWTAEIEVPFATVVTNTAGGQKHKCPVPSGSVWFLRILRHDVSADGKDESSSWTRFGATGEVGSAVYGHLFFDTINPNAPGRTMRMIEPNDPDPYQPRNGQVIHAVDVGLLDQGIRWPVEPAAKRYYFQLSRRSDFPPKATFCLDTDQPHAAPTFTLVPGKWYWRYRMRTYDGKVSPFSKTRCFVVQRSEPQERPR